MRKTVITFEHKTKWTGSTQILKLGPMTNLWLNIDMSLTYSWNNYADNKTSEKQKVQRCSFCNLNGPGLLNQTLKLYPGSLHHCSRARKALIRYRAATAWPSWFSIYTVRPQNINWPDWKHTSFVIFICFSQNIWRHSAIGGD